MGPKNACSYADISVSEIDNKVFEHEYSNPCAGATIEMTVLAYGMDHEYENGRMMYFVFRILMKTWHDL